MVNQNYYIKQDAVFNLDCFTITENDETINEINKATIIRSRPPARRTAKPYYNSKEFFSLPLKQHLYVVFNADASSSEMVLE